MKLTRRAATGGALAVTATAFVTPALAGPALQQTAGPRSVVALAGGPHLWIADDQGILHWGGDTRALDGKTVNWGDRREVSLDQLKSYRLGDPWLSAGLLKLGDPIYLVKWEVNEAQPRLLHIQAIADVEVFGINGANYGSFVMDQAAWEQRFSMSAAGLARGVLPSTPSPRRQFPPPPRLLCSRSRLRNSVSLTRRTSWSRMRSCSRAPRRPSA